MFAHEQKIKQDTTTNILDVSQQSLLVSQIDTPTNTHIKVHSQTHREEHSHTHIHTNIYKHQHNQS